MSHPKKNRIRPPPSEGFHHMRERFGQLQNAPKRAPILRLSASQSQDSEDLPAMELILTDEDEVSLLSGGSFHPPEDHPPIQVVPTVTTTMTTTTTTPTAVVPFNIPIDTCSLVSKPRSILKTDVQWCHSKGCQACRPSRPGPRFLRAPRVEPKDIQRLPRRWWLQENYDQGLLDNMFASLVQLFGVRNVTEACGGKEYLPTQPQLKNFSISRACGADLCQNVEMKEEEEEMPFDELKERVRDSPTKR